MDDIELREKMAAVQWKTPLRKIACLLFHRQHWRYFLDWDTGTKRTGVVHCDRCKQWHVTKPQATEASEP